MGKIVKTLMDEGATLGVSSRGMGSLDQKWCKLREKRFLSRNCNLI